ncbi:hypothetical protein [Longimicrobium sp.]|jgi:hypothetical protein|uniref:hypothetical protein n=1 Tax=Longimicrobium sp. TaxID=2029185 RepID=UPI002F933D0A
MALITCGDCHQQISDAAPACIHCGRPNRPLSPGAAPKPMPVPSEFRRARALRRNPPTKPFGWLRTAAVAVVILAVLLGIAFGEWSEGVDSLLRGFGMLAVGIAVILSDHDEPAAPANRGPRKSWGDHFAAQDRQQDFQWTLIFGGILIALGIADLALAALDAVG